MLLKLLLILSITCYAVLADHSNSKHDLQSTDAVKTNAVKKTIQSEDGDIIDCVHIYKQPSLSHPALKDHQIQVKPSFVPTIDLTSRRFKEQKDKNRKVKAEVGIVVTKQKWQRSGSCPVGTVPIIRRPQNNTTSQFTNFIHSRKPAKFNKSQVVPNLLSPNHSRSILIAEGFAYLGGQADLGIYYPSVELDTEYSLSHVTLENGGSDKIEQVRAGWAVNPQVYKDRQTRFFVYWTADGSKQTGCFDSTCPGFVQVSSTIAPGAALDLDPKDLNGPPPPIMPIYIVKDPSTNNWWVQKAGHNVGYFPPNLFGALTRQASSVQWGGDVQSSRIDEVHPHTSTDMGNGQYASRDFGAGIWKIRVLENSWELKFPETASTYADESSCYNNVLYKEFGDPEFYYGGPGQDPRCP